MSKLKSMSRKLDKYRVMIAKETERQRIEVVKKMLKERAEKDLEFAQDVLKAVGENLPPEIKKAAEETIARETKAAEKVKWLNEKAKIEDGCIVTAGDTTPELVPIQTDGGGEVLVHPTELLDYPRDGAKIPIGLPTKEIVEEVDSKAIKAVEKTIIDSQRFGVNKIEFEVKPELQEYK